MLLVPVIVVAALGTSVAAQAPDDSEAREAFLRAHERMDERDYRAALSELDRAVQLLGTSNLAIQPLIVEACYQSGQLERARAEVGRFFALGPDRELEVTRRMTVLKDELDERLKGVDTEFDRAWTSGDLAMAQRFVHDHPHDDRGDELLERARVGYINAELERGQAAFEAGDFAAASAPLESLATRLPDLDEVGRWETLAAEIRMEAEAHATREQLSDDRRRRASRLREEADRVEASAMGWRNGMLAAGALVCLGGAGGLGMSMLAANSQPTEQQALYGLACLSLGGAVFASLATWPMTVCCGMGLWEAGQKRKEADELEAGVAGGARRQAMSY
jgi:hypothetical protein